MAKMRQGGRTNLRKSSGLMQRLQGLVQPDQEPLLLLNPQHLLKRPQ